MSDAEIREQLAYALVDNDSVWLREDVVRRLAERLLPVVRRAQAAALRDAADQPHDEYSGWEAADVVRARADELDPQ